MPNAVHEPRACIRPTLATAMRTGFPLDRIIFEFTEDEKLDTDHLLNIPRTYRAMGFKTAIEDFGAGHAGLGLLSKYCGPSSNARWRPIRRPCFWMLEGASRGRRPEPDKPSERRDGWGARWRKGDGLDQSPLARSSS
jgi:hypothetical protein